MMGTLPDIPGIKAGAVNLRTDRVRNTEEIVYKTPDYDPLKGGAFSEFVKNDPDTVVVGTKKIEREEDRVVKSTGFNVPSNKVPRTGKMEVAGDQVNVKDISTIVSSSTSGVTAAKSSKPTVMQADDGQAEHIIISKKKTATVETIASKPKKSFTVDNMTPAIAEGATLDEVNKATAKFDGTQDARIVKKVGEKKMAMPSEPTEVEGIVLKKTDFSKASSGSTPVADLSGVKTQEEVNAIEKEIEKKDAAQLVGKPNYIDMLPDDWSALHWVKKEKFILEINDVEFLKFIMKVESVKAVHAACRKRMTELAKKSSNG
jgi:hypothetical protein